MSETTGREPVLSTGLSGNEPVLGGLLNDGRSIQELYDAGVNLAWAIVIQARHQCALQDISSNAIGEDWCKWLRVVRVTAEHVLNFENFASALAMTKEIFNTHLEAALGGSVRNADTVGISVTQARARSKDIAEHTTPGEAWAQAVLEQLLSTDSWKISKALNNAVREWTFDFSLVRSHTAFEGLESIIKEGYVE